MLLMPKQDWQWRYNDTYSVLSISLGSDMEFMTPYKFKSLIPDAKIVLKFSVEHARFYIDLIELISSTLALSDAANVQIALNATAAHFLLCPQMPRSWYFDTSIVCVYSERGKVFQLKSQQMIAQVLVLDTSMQASLVMLLSKELPLSSTKTLQQFECIKVMHDRLHPLAVNISHTVAA